ncbi:MAG: ATP-dependent helicase [Verrucomicrobiota bacterium]
MHYDPWWNPAVEEQATGRAHRMGQQNPVFVYRFVTQGTIEERILELQERKAEMARAILGDDLEPGERKQGLGLEQEDLEALFAPLQETR